MRTDMKHKPQDPPASKSLEKSKRPYQKPELIEYGKVRDLTAGPPTSNVDFGGSPGLG